jgi:hypothetical protein
LLVVGLAWWITGFNGAVRAIEAPKLPAQREQVRELLANGKRALALQACEAVLADPSATSGDRLWATLWAAELGASHGREGTALDRLVAAPRADAVAASLLDLATLKALDSARYRAPESLTAPDPESPPSTWPEFALEDLADRLLRDLDPRWAQLAGTDVEALAPFATTTIPAADAPTFLDQYLLGLLETVRLGEVEAEDLLGSAPAAETEGARRLVRMIRDRAAELDRTNQARAGVALRLAVADRLLRWRHDVEEPELAAWVQAVEADPSVAPEIRARAALIWWGKLPWATKQEPEERARLEAHLGAPGVDGEMVWDALNPPSSRTIRIAADGIVPPGRPLEVTVAGAPSIELEARWLEGPTAPPQRSVVREVSPGKVSLELAPGRWELTARHPGRADAASDAVVHVWVSAIGAEIREGKDGWDVFVYSTRDGSPIEGAEVEGEVCAPGPRKPPDTHGNPRAVTNAVGLGHVSTTSCRLPREPSWDWNGEQPVVFRARHDGSEITLQLVRPRALAPTGSRQKLVVYPDHWLYEPGDTVRALVLALEDDGSGEWRALSNHELEVKLERGEEVLAVARAQSDSRGRAEIALPLAEDVVLGEAWLQVSAEAAGRAMASLQIDRPRRPTIEVLRDRPVEVGDVVRISGLARSLVGASLAGARVEVRASDLAVGAPAEQLWAETIVGEQGEWAVEFPRPKEHWGAQVLVTAADGETSMTRVGGGSPGFRQVAVDTEDLVGWAGQSRKIRIYATGFGFGAHAWILERVEPRPNSASRNYPGVWRSWPRDTRFERPVTVARGEVVLGGPSWWSNPEGEVELPPLSAGTYRLRLEGPSDHDGGLFAVVSSKPVRDLQLPSELLVWIDEEAGVGGELVVGIWCAPRFGSAAIETVIDELQVDRAGEVPCGVAQRFAIPVRAVHRRHGLVARVFAVHDGALVSQVVRFDPSRFDRTLGIDLESRSAGPGNVAIEAGVRDLVEARPVAADVLAVARDRAHQLLGDSFGWWELARGSEALWKLPELRVPYRVATAGRVTGHGAAPPPRATPPRVLTLASPHRTWQQPTPERSPLQVVGVEPPPVYAESIVVTESPAGLSEPPGYAAELGPQPEPRGEAPKVALWLPNLRTDADGRVEIPFPLPNALGEWEVEVHALSDDFAVGWAHTVVATRRPLQVRWIAPRVMRRGDRVVAQVAVDNRSAQPAVAEVALEPADLPGVKAIGWPQELRIEPGATVLLPVELQPEVGTELLELVVRGRAGNHADAERVRIVVEPAAAHLAVGDAAVLGGGDEVTLAAGFGGNDPGLAADRRLEVKVWGDATPAIEEALSGVAASSAKCLDERVRRVVALVRLGQGSFDQATIDEMVAELAEHQAPSGALPWLPGGPPSLAATLHILEDLAELEAVKSEAVQAIAGRALPWVMAELERNAAAKPPNRRVWVQGLAALAAWPASSPTGAAIDPVRREALWKGFKRHHRDLSRYGRARLATAAVRDGRAALAEDLLEELVAQLGREQGLVSFRGGPRDWRSAAAEPEALLTAAALLEALVEADWPDARVADDLSGWMQRDLAANGPRCSSLELLTVSRALAAHRAARGLSGSDGVVWARVGNERREVAVGSAASSLEWSGPEVASEMRDLRVGMTGPEAARAVVGARLEWVSEVLPQSEVGGALRVERRVLVRDAGSRSGWREVVEGEVMAPGEELAVELVIDSALPLDAVRLIDPRPAGFDPVDEASGSVWVDSRHAWRQVHPGGLELWIERLPAGRMAFTHTLRARFGGEFRIPPARVEAFYTPMLAGTSSGARVGVQHLEVD